MNAGDDLLDLLALRYSVGPKYLVPPGPSAEQWARAADLALRAPDHGGLRPFRFVVVGDSQRIALAELFATGAMQRGQSDEEVERGLDLHLGVGGARAARPRRAGHICTSMRRSKALRPGLARAREAGRNGARMALMFRGQAKCQCPARP